jgi:hypothetical protein
MFEIVVCFKIPPVMGADFSKFQMVLAFALLIFPADNLKGFKIQLKTKS